MTNNPFSSIKPAHIIFNFGDKPTKDYFMVGKPHRQVKPVKFTGKVRKTK